MARIPKSTLDGKPEKELRELAMDIFKERVFTSEHFASREEAQRMFQMVFMPLALMERKMVLSLQRKERPAMFYEYMDRAGPRAINGYPMFFSMQMLGPEDTQKVWRFYNEIKQASEHD